MVLSVSFYFASGSGSSTTTYPFTPYPFSLIIFPFGISITSYMSLLTATHLEPVLKSHRCSSEKSNTRLSSIVENDFAFKSITYLSLLNSFPNCVIIIFHQHNHKYPFQYCSAC